MPRLPPIVRDDLTPEFQKIYDVIASGRRAGLGGPFSALIYNPTIAEPANALHNAFRLHGKLDRRLFELVVSMVAHHWSAEYAWSVHANLALKAGLKPDVLEAIRNNRRPETMSEDETLVYELVKDLLDRRTLGAERYEMAISRFGAELMLEMVAAVGFYGMLCGVINVFEIPPER